MAKPKTQESTELTVVNENTNVAIPQDFLGTVDAYAAEVEEQKFAPEDLITPRIKVLQSGSPEVKKSNPKYIEGAAEGELFNTATKEVYSGGKGIVITTCFFNTDWVEWIPQDAGGGMVKKWGDDESFKTMGYKEEKGKWVKKNDQGENILEIVNTANYYVLLINPETGSAKPAIITLGGTDFKKRRGWNAHIAMTEIPKPDGSFINGTKIPFWNMFHITTVPESNDTNSWFGFKIDKYKPITSLPNFKAVWEQSADFRKMIAEGKVKTIDMEQDETPNANSDTI